MFAAQRVFFPLFADHGQSFLDTFVKWLENVIARERHDNREIKVGKEKQTFERKSSIAIRTTISIDSRRTHTQTHIKKPNETTKYCKLDAARSLRCCSVRPKVKCAEPIFGEYFGIHIAYMHFMREVFSFLFRSMRVAQRPKGNEKPALTNFGRWEC